MTVIILLVSGIIGLLHLVIMGLEMFASSEKQAKTFDMPYEFVTQKNAQIALKNMGIYNGSLGLAILASLLMFEGDVRLKNLAALESFCGDRRDLRRENCHKIHLCDSGSARDSCGSVDHPASYVTRFD
jgi:putative membrane protein